MGSLCRVRNQKIYVRSWRTVYVFTGMFLWWLFPSFLCISGNEHKQSSISWAHKLFASPAHALFFIHSQYDPGQAFLDSNENASDTLNRDLRFSKELRSKYSLQKRNNRCILFSDSLIYVFNSNVFNVKRIIKMLGIHCYFVVSMNEP